LGKYQRRGMLPSTWLWRAFLESTHTDIQAYYPAPPYLPMPPNYDINDKSGTLLPVPGVPVAGLPLVRPLDSTPPKSTVRLLPASGISNGDFSNNTYPFTRVNTAPNFPVALILSGTSHIPPPVESREEREPQDRPHLYQKSRKKGEVESLHWSGRPTNIRKACIRRFSCDDCGAEYAQPQGVKRHYRAKHDPRSCVYCGAKWSRPYQHRDHLEKHHPDVDPDLVLGKAAESRRRSAFPPRHRSQDSLPTIEHGRWGHSGITRYPPSTVVEPSTITVPPPDMAYVPQPESTQPIMTSKNILEGAMNWIILCYLFS
jgi:hypothetical protein